MTKEELDHMEQQARITANSLLPIRDIQCPRDIINPGLYFGFVYGFRKAIEYRGPTQEELDELFLEASKRLGW